ncbi:MAG: hypothetical protein P1V20_18215 [Verrucomicrobiales bacterium]|nr:hypothetical protein [Verrucomicrobiales bacterium]
MKLFSAPLLLSLAVVFALATTSCGKREEEATQIIVPDREVTNLRKPAQPVEVQYPLYPETAELGPDPQYFPKAEKAPSILDGIGKSGGGNGSASSGILESILNDPKNAAAIEGAIASAMEQAPVILEGIMNQTGEGTSPALEEILSGGEISPEAINQATDLISEYAPALLEGMMSGQTGNEEGEQSLGSAIAGMLFRKLLESGNTKEIEPAPKSGY